MRPMMTAATLIAMLAGCAGGKTASTPPPPQAQCDNSKLDGFVGQKASADLAARMMAASGAKALRWGPPRSAMTMDFRSDRLTVAYDDAMTVTSARCG
jgi:hypothetical protein